VKSRLVMVLIAIFLGTLAALGVGVYANGIKSKVDREQRTVKVMVATENIPEGKGLREITKKRLVSFKEVPEKYVTSKAISSDEGIDDQVLAIPVNEGEQLTVDKFKYDTKAGLSFAVPKGRVAISIEIDEVTGVSGMIKAGDLVNVIAYISDVGETKSPDVAKILFQDVKVLAVGSVIAPEKGRAEEKKTLGSGRGTTQQTKRTVTLSLTPEESEKLVFAKEKGKIWLSLLPASGSSQVHTPGQTIETIFGK